MAGARLFGSSDVASRGFVCIITLVIGGFCAVLGVDTVAMAPNSTNASVEEGGCYRALVDVIWGFLVTLLALTISVWGSFKHKGDENSDPLILILAGLFAPIQDLQSIIFNSFWFGIALWKCHKTQDPNSTLSSYSWLKLLCSSLKPWSKSLVRILAGCDIVVYTTKNSALLEEEWLWEDKTIDESEALVIGENGARSTQNEHYERKILSREGNIVLIWKEIVLEGDDTKCLPKYERLKLLRGNSGFAVIAIAVQALGYIYAVGFRSAKNLKVAPLEVIGLILNIILLIKASLFSTCNPCHRPLVIYANSEWERDFSNGLKIYDGRIFSEKHLMKRVALFVGGITFGVVLCTSIVLIHYIVSIMRYTNITIVLPLILFLIGIFLDYILFLLFYFKSPIIDHGVVGMTLILIVVVNAIAYISAIVVTMLYWKSKQFNTRAKLVNLSQLILFIG